MQKGPSGYQAAATRRTLRDCPNGDQTAGGLGRWSLAECDLGLNIGPMPFGALVAALINLNGSGHYIHWGFIQISVANFVVIMLMITVFVLAILLPFPRRKGPDQ